MVVAGLCLLAFVSTLWTRIASSRRADAISPLPLLAGGVAAVCIALGGVVQATITGGMIFGTVPEPGADTLRLANDMSYPILLVAGMFAASLTVGTLSVQARAAGLIGRRLLARGLLAAG